MKTMRYRIRVISFVLVCALLASLFVVFRAFWLPSETSGLSVPSAVPSSSVSSDVDTEDSESTAFIDNSPAVQETPSAEEIPTEKPLYDVFGL